MPRKPSRELTEAELPVMKILWDKGTGTVGEIAEALDTDPPLAYSTVLTTLRILESKGYVRHRKEGRAFVYEPAVAHEQASTGAVKHLLARFFNNSPELLLASLLQDERIGRKELDRLKRLIADRD